MTDPVLDDILPSGTLPLLHVARRLGTTTAALLALARKGEFCEVLLVSSRNRRVRVTDLANWLHSRWINPVNHAAAVAWVKAALVKPTPDAIRPRNFGRRSSSWDC